MTIDQKTAVERFLDQQEYGMENAQDTPVGLDDLRLRYLELAEQRDALNAELADIEATFASYGEGEHLDGNVVVSRGKRFNAGQAAKVIPDNLLPLVLVTTETIDSRKCKAVLPGAVYELCQKPNDKLTVKVQ